jgi:hypothetical protein
MPASESAPGTGAIPVRTIEQLSALRALRVLDRFTIGKLAAVAGLRPMTVRSLLSRWKDDGFPLLEEVAIERHAGAGQPPKVHIVAAGMKPILEASIKAADHLARAEGRSDEPGDLIDRMNLLDVAMEMIAGAEKTADPEARDKLTVEAAELVEQSRAVLRRREEAGRASASPALQQDLLRTEQRIKQIRHGLIIIINNVAAEMQKGRAKLKELLSIEVEHYIKITPGGHDAEVGFFGGFLVARGTMTDTQDTPLDEFLSAIVVRDGRNDPGVQDLPWKAVRKKFATAFGRVVECGAQDAAWYPILENCLAGVTKNSQLAVVGEIHTHVGRLMRETRSDALRLASQDFLEQYVVDASILTQGVAPAAEGQLSDVDPFFAPEWKLAFAPEPKPDVAASAWPARPSRNATRGPRTSEPAAWLQTLFGRRGAASRARGARPAVAGAEA